MGRLERGRENILNGVRKGYEHAHLILRRAAPQHSTTGMDGREAALQVRRGLGQALTQISCTAEAENIPAHRHISAFSPASNMLGSDRGANEHVGLELI